MIGLLVACYTAFGIMLAIGWAFHHAGENGAIQDGERVPFYVTTVLLIVLWPIFMVSGSIMSRRAK